MLLKFHLRDLDLETSIRPLPYGALSKVSYQGRLCFEEFVLELVQHLKHCLTGTREDLPSYLDSFVHNGNFLGSISYIQPRG